MMAWTSLCVVRREESGFKSMVFVPRISSRSIILMRSFGFCVGLNVMIIWVLVFLSKDEKNGERGMVEILSNIMRICGVEVRGAVSGSIPRKNLY